MDTLHTMLRSLKSDSTSQTPQLTAVRALLDQLDRVARRASPRRKAAGKRTPPEKRARKR